MIRFHVNAVPWELQILDLPLANTFPFYEQAASSCSLFRAFGSLLSVITNAARHRVFAQALIWSGICILRKRIPV